MNRRTWLACVALATVGWSTGGASAGTEIGNHRAALPGLRISGPHAYQNLAVYLIHSDRAKSRKFITLNDGLKRGLVKVREMKTEQVRQLTVENLSDDPLFLQEGDRVTGGKQDRTLYTSVIIPPKSGPQSIPTFCIEQSRWTVGQNGRSFASNSNAGYALNDVRKASKLYRNQGRVWQQVAVNKRRLMMVVGTSNATSSLNEAQDSKKIVAATAEFGKRLGKLAALHKDVVGVAFVINGHVEEAAVYPSAALAAQVYPRLLETYALDAVLKSKEKSAGAQPPSRTGVERFIGSKLESKAIRDEKIDARNRLRIFGSTAVDARSMTRVYLCTTEYEGRPVHLQWIRETQDARSPAAARGLNSPPHNVFNRSPQLRNDYPNPEPANRPQQRRR